MFDPLEALTDRPEPEKQVEGRELHPNSNPRAAVTRPADWGQPKATYTAEDRKFAAQVLASGCKGRPKSPRRRYFPAPGVAPEPVLSEVRNPKAERAKGKRLQPNK